MQRIRNIHFWADNVILSANDASSGFVSTYASDPQIYYIQYLLVDANRSSLFPKVKSLGNKIKAIIVSIYYEWIYSIQVSYEQWRKAQWQVTIFILHTTYIFMYKHRVYVRACNELTVCSAHAVAPKCFSHTISKRI